MGVALKTWGYFWGYARKFKSMKSTTDANCIKLFGWRRPTILCSKEFQDNWVGNHKLSVPFSDFLWFFSYETFIVPRWSSDQRQKLFMIPIIQRDRTGCAIPGVFCQEAKRATTSLCIFVDNKALWSLDLCPISFVLFWFESPSRGNSFSTWKFPILPCCRSNGT